MHDMRHMRPLAPTDQRREATAHGEARLRRVRSDARSLDHISTTAHLPKTQGSCTGCGQCPRSVVGQVVGLTAKEWRVGT